MYQATTHICVYRMLWGAGKEGSAADTLDAPPEDAYFPAGQLVHGSAPASAEARPSVVRISHGTLSSGHRHYQHRVCVCVRACVCVCVRACVCASDTRTYGIYCA